MGSKVSSASQGGATYASSTGIASTGQSSSSPHRQDQTQSITSSLINLVTNRNNASQAPSHAQSSVALRECRPSNAAVRPAYSRSYSTSHSEMVSGHTDILEPNRGHPEVNRSMSISSNAGVNRSESTGSSSSGGFGHFLSNFSLWRPSVNSDRQRTRSLSHMPDAEAQGGPHAGRDVSPGLALVSDENRAEVERNNYGRTALARLLPGSSSGTRNRDSLSDRDLTAAQDLLAEASLAGLGLGLGRVFVTHSLPAHIWALNGIKCPVCSKFVMPDDIECHLVMCLTKPRLSYNEDVLAEDKGECVICLEELLQGHTIARLPCLCVYHKNCIDNWFEVNRSCPEHPSD